MYSIFCFFVTFVFLEKLIRPFDTSYEEFEIEEVVGVFSTWLQIGEDVKVTDAKAEDIIEAQPEDKDIILRLKFSKKTDNGQFFFEDINESIRAGKKTESRSRNNKWNNEARSYRWSGWKVLRHGLFIFGKLQRIQKWDAEVLDHGATIRDVEKLERILKRSIILRDNRRENLRQGKVPTWQKRWWWKR